MKLKETVCFDLNPRLAVQNIANSAIEPQISEVFFIIFRGEEFLPVILMSFNECPSCQSQHCPPQMTGR